MRRRVSQPRRGRYVAYLVRCADATYYAGSTNNVAARIRRHNAGQGAKYLQGRGPVRLVYAKAYGDYRQALRAEAGLKKLTRRAKELLIQRFGQNRSRFIHKESDHA